MAYPIKRHSLKTSVILHLLPGILTGLVYFALAPVVEARNFPSVMALILAGIFALIPFELGYLIYQQSKSGKLLKGDIIRYQNPMKMKQYIIYIFAVFMLSGFLFTILGFTSTYLSKLFSWMPSEMILHMGLNGEYPLSNLIITYGLFLIFGVIVLPLTEELYFRGYLLPRMPARLKGWTNLTHSALFALYHTWTPWMFVSRTMGVLPLIYSVKRTQNLKVGFISHCLLNSIDFIVGFIFIMQLL